MATVLSFAVGCAGRSWHLWDSANPKLPAHGNATFFFGFGVSGPHLQAQRLWGMSRGWARAQAQFGHAVTPQCQFHVCDFPQPAAAHTRLADIYLVVHFCFFL